MILAATMWIGVEQVHLPRDAFFARTEQIPAGKAAGRITAEMLTPYPPGIPAALPGERLTPADEGSAAGPG